MLIGMLTGFAIRLEFLLDLTLKNLQELSTPAPFHSFASLVDSPGHAQSASLSASNFSISLGYFSLLFTINPSI